MSLKSDQLELSFSIHFSPQVAAAPGRSQAVPLLFVNYLFVFGSTL